MCNSILDRLTQNFRTQPGRNAFFIAGRYYTYGEFQKYVAAVQTRIRTLDFGEHNYIGIACFDDIETYASVFAAWFSGKAYVPVHPLNPAIRNNTICNQAGLKYLLHSKVFDMQSKPDVNGLNFITTSDISLNSNEIELDNAEGAADAYILFTSGSTGLPKGVRITRNNLDAYIRSIVQNSYSVSSADRYLQIYDLSFDASIRNYCLALYSGGCLYTVPQKVIKYLYAYELMRDHELTVISMPPSTLAYLQPYFNSIRLPKVRYSLFGGEPLPDLLVNEWQDCVPNATIRNVYGPTEVTVNCLYYTWNPGHSPAKTYNGIVSIGKVFGENRMLVLDPEDGKPVAVNIKGELCIGGPQVSPGYLNDPEGGSGAFFEMEASRFYKTGDLVFRDKEGDVMFCGRIDNQLQIQGFRVEPGEIEKHARDFLKGANVAAVAVKNEKEIPEIFLFTENCDGKEELLVTYLSHCIPSYMMPRRIFNRKILPVTTGGKIDRNGLINLLSE
jgi:amino acid adenylation domain-containing protein